VSEEQSFRRWRIRVARGIGSDKTNGGYYRNISLGASLPGPAVVCFFPSGTGGTLLQISRACRYRVALAGLAMKRLISAQLRRIQVLIGQDSKRTRSAGQGP
jgi:hypothetical protein